MAVILVGGGARSGKSSYALDLARKAGPRLVFLATAEPFDSEMETRIARHRADRAEAFTTIEEPLRIAETILNTDADAILIDCLTLWLSNIMHTFGSHVDAEIDKLVEAARNAKPTLVFVTNEVGGGIVPDSTLGRDFRDHAGILNQRVASISDEVYFMIFGQPLRVK